ncbi:hypothetical protein ACJJIP_11350 [Microbulbifer sp. VTAC004]|uniref:hypothetical protein n=1 Tax=unclassified Microbulbifer TaxID=2619833 RepID=UPI00403965CC
MGSALLPTLRRKGYTVTSVYRQAVEGGLQIDSLSAETNWCRALENINVVIYSAARVHVIQEVSADPPSRVSKS